MFSSSPQTAAAAATSSICSSNGIHSSGIIKNKEAKKQLGVIGTCIIISTLFVAVVAITITIVNNHSRQYWW